MPKKMRSPQWDYGDQGFDQNSMLTGEKKDHSGKQQGARIPRPVQYSDDEQKIALVCIKKKPTTFSLHFLGCALQEYSVGQFLLQIPDCSVRVNHRSSIS